MSSMLVYHTPHLTRYPIWGMWAVGIRVSDSPGRTKFACCGLKISPHGGIVGVNAYTYTTYW